MLRRDFVPPLTLSSAALSFGVSVCSSGHLMICTYRPAATHVHPQLKNPAKIGDGGSGNLTHLVKNNECQRYPMIILTYSFCSTCVYVGYRNIGISLP